MEYLGLDIGGSKCRFEWSPSGAAAGGNLSPGDMTPEQLHGLLASACGERTPAAAVCAIAGFAERDRAEQLERGLRERGIGYPVRVVGDVLAAAAAGLREGPGVLVWSGTGSFAIARGDDGELARVGGRGFAFGDEGSGYDLVRRAISLALRAVDGRGRETVLVDMLTESFGAPAPERLGAVAQRLSPGEVASRLPIVMAAFAQSDWVAADVLEAGMHQLAQLAKDALRRVGSPPAAGVRVALGGGVLANNATVRDGLVHMMQASFGGELSIQTLAPHAAAEATAWLAQGWHEGESLRKRWVERVAL